MEDREVLLISAALADPTRYRLLKLICGRETATSEGLRELLDVSPATISHHLRQLRDADLIVSFRDGRRRLHRVRRETLGGYVRALARL